METQGVRCEGDLFGKRYVMEVLSRRRLPGDLKDAVRRQFIGSFEHEDGVSGDFTIRERDDGELMTLGLYGTPQTIRIVKTEPRAVLCALEVCGVAGADIRLEKANDPWHAVSTQPADMSARRGKHYYVGRCTMDSQDETVPMASVLATMALLYDLILVRYYMDMS